VAGRWRFPPPSRRAASDRPSMAGKWRPAVGGRHGPVACGLRTSGQRRPVGPPQPLRAVLSRRSEAGGGPRGEKGSESDPYPPGAALGLTGRRARPARARPAAPPARAPPAPRRRPRAPGPRPRPPARPPAPPAPGAAGPAPARRRRRPRARPPAPPAPPLSRTGKSPPLPCGRACRL
jgi:hypothetical protein